MVVDSSGARSQGRGKALFLTLKAPIEHLFISYFLCRLIVLYYMTCSTSYASFITFTTTVDLLFWEHVCGLNYFFYCVIVGSICSFLYLEHHSLAKRGNHTVRRCFWFVRSEGFYPDALYLVFLSLYMFLWCLDDVLQLRNCWIELVCSECIIFNYFITEANVVRQVFYDVFVCLSHLLSLSLSHPPLPPLPQVAKWIHFSGSGGKGSKRKRAGPKVNFKEVRPRQSGFK